MYFEATCLYLYKLVVPLFPAAPDEEQRSTLECGGDGLIRWMLFGETGPVVN